MNRLLSHSLIRISLAITILSSSTTFAMDSDNRHYQARKNIQQMGCPANNVRELVDAIIWLHYEYCVMGDLFGTFNVEATEQLFDQFSKKFGKFILEQVKIACDSFTHKKTYLAKPIQDALIQRVKEETMNSIQGFVRKYNKGDIAQDFLVSPEQMREYVQWYKSFYNTSIIKIATTCIFDVIPAHIGKQIFDELCNLGYGCFIDDNYNAIFSNVVTVYAPNCNQQ